MKKKLFLALLLLLLAAVLDAAAQVPYISPSDMAGNAQAGAWSRKSPCQSGAGDNCGSEPPVWHVPPQQCGFLFSTSSARNESYSYPQSGDGIKTAFPFYFPYFDVAHLEVLVGGVVQASGAYSVTAPIAYPPGVQTPAGTVTFTAPPPVGVANVVIRLKTTWAGDGVTATFPFNFFAKYPESVEVRVNNVLQTYPAAYSIAGLYNPTGGSVTLTTPPSATATVQVSMISISTKGVAIDLPTRAEQIAAGFQPGGASAAGTGYLNREGQCRIGIIPAAPSPFNFGRFTLHGVPGVDKFTNMWDGGQSIDCYDCDIPIPEGWGQVWVNDNGTSWLYDGTSPNQGQRFSMGQYSMHGQVRLSLVTGDYPWGWSVGSMIGKLALCPKDGRGLNTNANDHVTMAQMPAGCVFGTPPTGASVDYWQITQTTGTSATGVTQGAAYAAGTSPDGDPYLAGNYAVIVMSAPVTTLQSGTTLFVQSLPMTLGSQINGRWIVKRLTPGVDPGCAAGSPACLELHEEVQDWNQNKVWGVGPPSRFLAGDTRKDTGTQFCCMAHTLTPVALAGGRKTDPVMGVELVGSTAAPEGTIVGLVATSSSAVSDVDNVRNLASWFNPVEKKCPFGPATDKTTTSTAFVEMDNTQRCTFVYTNRISTRAALLGDTGSRVRYDAFAAVSNNTAGQGCEIGMSVDGGAIEETNPPGFTNPAGSVGGITQLFLTGNKTGLSEGQHTLRLFWRVKGSGTCSAAAANTRANGWIMQ